MPDTAPARGFRLGDMIGHGIEPPPLEIITRQPWHPWLIVGITCLGAFIGQLDASIVQLALPILGTAFHASLEAVTWVALAYLLAFAGFLPIFGRLCEMFGRKLLYLCGYLVFVVATALCGFAPDLTWLVVFRVLQGIGGALLGANSISILVNTVGQARRARALGIFAAAQAVGLSLGPAVGGVLLGSHDWRWIFWVTVPFGIIALVLGLVALPQTVIIARDKVFDWWGAILLTPALIALVLALNQLAALGPTSIALLACVALAVVLLAAFVRRERTFASPLVDLRLFANPDFSCGAVGVVLGYALLYGMFFLMSYALIRGYHLPEAVAGFRLTIIPVAIGIAAPLAGALADRLVPQLISAVGMAACFIAVLAIAVLAPEERIGLVIGLGLLALFGAGIGLFMAANNSATMGAAPANLSGEAGGMLNLMRSLGTSLGVASATSMLSWRLQVLTHAPPGSEIFEGDPLLGAIEGSLMLLMVFALIAGSISLIRYLWSVAEA